MLCESVSKCQSVSLFASRQKEIGSYPILDDSEHNSTAIGIIAVFQKKPLVRPRFTKWNCIIIQRQNVS